MTVAQVKQLRILDMIEYSDGFGCFSHNIDGLLKPVYMDEEFENEDLLVKDIFSNDELFSLIKDLNDDDIVLEFYEDDAADLEIFPYHDDVSRAKYDHIIKNGKNGDLSS